VFDVLLGAGSVGNMIFTSLMLLMTIQLQQVDGLDPIVAGAAFLSTSVGSGVAGQLSGRLERFDQAAVMTVGLLIGAVGITGLSLVEGWVLFSITFFLAGFGFGLTWAFASVATQAVVPTEQAGAASGTVLTVLVGLGGIMVAASAALLEGLTAGGRTALASIDVLLQAYAIAGVIAAVVTIGLGRDRRRSEHAAVDAAA
jgi:MFS family permease